jgi:hypothetical protein
MDVISSRPVAPGRTSSSPRPEILLRETSLWGTGFGGLQRRFKKGFYKDVRLIDPWSGRALRFKSGLHADNWLLRAFDPGCASYDIESESLQILCRGEFIAAKPFGSGQLFTGGRFADLVVKKETDRSCIAWRRLVQASEAHGIVAYKRTATEIRANLVLLRNLETMRAHLVMHVACLVEAIAITPRIIAGVGAEPMRVGALAAAIQAVLPHLLRTTIDFALFRAYRRGELRIDVESLDFGDHSTVAACARSLR